VEYSPIEKEYDVNVFNIEVKKVPKTTTLLISDKIRIATLVGDSSRNAHFRIGIGVNNAFNSLQEFEILMEDLKKIFQPKSNSFPLDKKSLLDSVVRRKNEADDKRMTEMVQTQLSIIFLESYCHMIVNLEPKIPLIDDSELNDDGDDGFFILDNKMKAIARSTEMFSLQRTVYKKSAPGVESVEITDYPSLLKNCDYLKNKKN